MEKESKELQKKLNKLNSEIKDKDKLSDQQKEKIKDLEEEIEKPGGLGVAIYRGITTNNASMTIAGSALSAFFVHLFISFQ